MSPEPIYEFLLWNTCKNNCKFCHQKANKARFPGKFPDDEGKYKSIKLVERYIKNGNCIDGSNILLMGGELFDTKLSEKTEYAFLQLIDTIVNRMYNQQTFLFYMNSNLIYEDLDLLYKVLERFNLNIIGRNLSSRIIFTTSYDIGYRYRIETDKWLVEQNLKKLSNDFPHVNKVANFILTDKGCDFLLNHPNFYKEFRDEYHCLLNPIPYIILDPAMAASRKTVQNTLLGIEYENPGFIEQYVHNMCIEQERILLEYNGTELINASSKNAECGHNENFRRVYKNDNRCFVCDCLKLKEVTNL